MTIKHDFTISSSRPSGIGSNLYLLGISEDGPYMEPVHVKSKTEARKIYGDDSKGTLVKAFDEAYDKNKDISIYLMRITGAPPSLHITQEDQEVWDEENNAFLEKDVVSFSSIYAGEKYNLTSISLIRDEDEDLPALLFMTPIGNTVYPISDDLTIGGLCKTINDDCRAGLHPILASSDHNNDLAVHILTEFFDPLFLSGGSDGLDVTRDDLYLAVDLAYHILQGRPIDVIVPVDMYVDDIHPSYIYGQAVYGTSYYSHNRDYLQLIDTENNNKPVSYHERLIDFCREQIKLGYMTHGVIGIRPLDVVPHNINHDNSYIKRLIEATAFRERIGFLEFVNGAWFDKGFYVSVVASELIFNKGTPEEYYANGAVRYASIVSGHFDTTTNLSLGDDIELRYELSEEMRAGLSQMGIVTFRDSVRLGFVVHSGVTTALAQTDYHTLANVRMIQLTVAYINEAVDLIYDEEVGSGIRRIFLEELIRERLRQLRTWRVIDEYDYKIGFRADEKYGIILLSLKTKYSVDGIQVTADIKPPEDE